VGIRSSNPALHALRKALVDLATECDAACVAVIDDGNGLWCTSHGGFEEAADRFYRTEIALQPEVHLRRGKPLHVVRDQPPDRAYLAESFASIYVVIVFFDRAFEPFTARTQLRAALPRIEALTLSLPPPFGPDDGEGTGQGRA
jgi:hypothetical protein